MKVLKFKPSIVIFECKHSRIAISALSALSSYVFLCVFCLVVLCFSPSAFSQADSNEKTAQQRATHFKNIDELVSLHVPGLAYRYLQKNQAQYNKAEPTNWLYWEQKRISLLKYMQQWNDIDKRIDSQLVALHNTKIATADRNWFLTQRLQALIKLKRNEQALNDVRKLLWDASELVDSNTFAAWRRIVIQVYLNQGNVNDARIAMRRYRQDYGDLNNEDGVAWLQLQAELLIQLQQYDEAIHLLKGMDTPQAEVLMVLVNIKVKKTSPFDAMENAKLILSSIVDEPKRKQLFQYIVLVCAKSKSESDQAIHSLESLLTNKNLIISNTMENVGGIKINADSLWDLYLERGYALANSKGLLKGDDVRWYALASNLFQTQPLDAKSLFAVLALKAHKLEHRQLAMLQLVKLIEINKFPLSLVNKLFTETQYIKSSSDVAADVRYRLIDYSLSQSNIKIAASLMADLKQPPEDKQQFEWNLRRSRVLILSGSFDAGAKILLDMLDIEKIDSIQAGKFLQVVFDLQTVEQYAMSLTLFNKLQAIVDDVRLHRELLFWKAESYHSLKQYEKAAFLFLKSAKSPDHIYDPWYHTATFRAAENLLAAGLYEDARQRYLHLLKLTMNAARKIVIQQRLQTIQLKRLSE